MQNGELLTGADKDFTLSQQHCLLPVDLRLPGCLLLHAGLVLEHVDVMSNKVVTCSCLLEYRGCQHTRAVASEIMLYEAVTVPLG